MQIVVYYHINDLAYAFSLYFFSYKKKKNDLAYANELELNWHFLP